VRLLANSFLFEFHPAIENLAGATRARELLVERALEYLGRLEKDAGQDRRLKSELAAAYEKVGDVQGNPGVGNKGNSSGALRSHQRALELRRELLRSAPKSVELRRDLASSLGKVGEMLRETGDPNAALDHYQERLAIWQQLSADCPRISTSR
jgi:tetratricopeptide (TPR) repeat protein